MSADFTLALDAATLRGSVALLRGLEVIAARDVIMRAEDEERLMPAVAACCDEAGVAPREISRVVCGEGPGSFTSLRIGASIAKGVAVAASCPMFAVSSLLLIVAAALPALPLGLYLSVLDAHREELFALLIEIAPGGAVGATGELQIIRAAELQRYAASRGAKPIGPGQEFDAWPNAAGVTTILPQVTAADAIDVVGWEPVYGRAAEAQVRWERAHGRALTT